MATKPSKTTLRKADVNKTISNKIAQKKSEANKNYKMSREVRPSKNDLSSTAAANRNLSNSYYKKYQENMKDISKLEGKFRPTNKKDFSKSLGNVANNKGMKKADVKRTITNKQIMLQNAKEDYNDLTRKWEKATPNQDRTKDKASINLNRIAANNKIKSLTKEIKSLKKTANKVNNKDLSKSLGNVTSNKGMKKSNIRGTMSEQRNRYYNAMVDADKALDRVNRAGTNKNERAYAEQTYFKAKDKMKAAAKQYNSLKKLKK